MKARMRNEIALKGHDFSRAAKMSERSWASAPEGRFEIVQKYPSVAKQAAEKLMFSREMVEKHTAGAKAHVDSTAFVPGINPRPTVRLRFSAACKAITFGPRYRHD